MTASVVLLVGLIGIFQGILVASRQNALANRATRATGIAAQVRGALDAHGRTRLFNKQGDPKGLLTGTACQSTVEKELLAGGLEKLLPTSADAWVVRCLFDLDKYEDSVAKSQKLLPGYQFEDRRIYRRLLVVIEKPDEVTATQVHQVAVVVSWNELSNRRFVRQFIGFYDSGSFGNETFVEL
jgi:hypothetical protein